MFWWQLFQLTMRAASIAHPRLKYAASFAILGLDVIEVSDDGSGIPRESRPYTATKHATSKIRNFDDIYTTSQTLGFRGEALFCLANISEKLVVATRTADEKVGQKLEFGRNGSLNQQKAQARRVGTTVSVHGFFNALPVRRADLKKRISVQRQRVFSMMQGCK